MLISPALPSWRILDIAPYVSFQPECQSRLSGSSASGARTRGPGRLASRLAYAGSPASMCGMMGPDQRRHQDTAWPLSRPGCAANG